MNKLISISFILLTISCTQNVQPIDGAEGPQGAAGEQGAKGEPGAKYEPPQTDAGDIIYYENKYRESSGQAVLTEGLICTLYTVPNSTTQIAGASLTTVGSFTHKDNFNVLDGPTNVGLPILPEGLRNNYKNWYIMRCTGQLVVLDDDYHNFEVTNDDGAVLYIGGAILVNNDGMHAVNTVSASKYIRRGITAFRIDYLQGNGNQALIIKMDGDVILKDLFYK